MITRKTRTQVRSERKKGFTLTEIAIVLGIMGLILGAIWVAAASVYNNQRVNTANMAIAQIAQNIRSLYATSGTTGFSAADMTATLIAAKAIPGNLVNGTALAGPFPGGKSAVYSTSDGDGFMIVMSKVPASNCIALLSSVGGTGRDPGLYAAEAITEGAPATADIVAVSTPIAAAITPASAAGTAANNAGGCKESSTATTFKVRFGFSLK